MKSLPLHFIAGISATLLLSGCEQQAAAQRTPQNVKLEVSAQTLRPRPAAITAELPGRTSAYLVAEVRPRVSGIIRSRNFVEGSEIKAGDVLYEIDPAPLQAAYDTAAAALQHAEGAVPNAEAKLERARSLQTQNIVSREALGDAEVAALQARADVASAKAAMETARINLDYATIRAPISGRIDASTVTVGALVTADQTTALTTIRELDRINVDVTQSSMNLLRLRKAITEGRIKANGTEVPVQLELEDGTPYGQPGELQFSNTAVAETVGTVTLRAVFPNPDRVLLPGMYVRASIQEGTAIDGFLLPQRAVSRNARGEPIAKFVTAANKIETRSLAVDRIVGNNWLVNRGIQDGDRIVVEGGQRVQDGQDVAVSAVVVDEATGELKADAGSGPNPAGQAMLSPPRHTLTTSSVR
ncbi:efflux RND transporter periplasmic adaptor subunit [Mesorhizobium sp. STM 4661]|uniref:efflux RND transporter periplasmic adaptor subunit n=1 Tax=Mesorhizobium sp. STM 4661 TaxID=1297570 RepID=UPI001FCA9567|nr:efflux RND transporter periplasmic adaptor subunit [Mesorhizobium sp. STM 4661]